MNPQGMYREHQSQQALEALEAVEWSPEEGPPGLSTVDALVLKIRCLIRLERFTDAFRLADLLTTPQPPDYRAAELLLLKGILWRLARGRVDRSILTLQQALELRPSPSTRAAVLAELGFCLAVKRCFDSALERVEEACTVAPEAPKARYRKGQILLLYRDLPRARACFVELQGTPDGERLARDGLAFLDLAEGELERATAHLDAIGPAFPDELWLRRRRLQLLAVIDPDAERALLEEIRTLSPGSDHAPRDAARLAELHYLAGRTDAARSELARAAALLDDEETSPDAVSMPERLAWLGKVLERGAPPQLTRAQNLPFLSRSREPARAAVELALRALGRDVAPDRIGEVANLAQAVELVRLAGLQPVRVTGQLETLEALLAQGAPLIVEGDDQLRLIVGVDVSSRGVLLRRPTAVGAELVPYAELRRVLDHGALAILPPDVTPRIATDPQLEVLDGLSGHSGPAATRGLEQLTEARPDLVGAWRQLIEPALEHLEAGEATPGAEEHVAGLIAQAGLRPACQAAYEGRLLEIRGDLPAAAARFEAALERDPDLELMLRAAELQRMLGQYEAAERHLWGVLERVPHHVQANMMMAGLYCDEEDRVLASHFVRVAMEVAPRDGYNLLNLGRLREMEGHFEAAAEAYEQALLHRRGDPFLLERLGVVLSAQDRHEEAFARLRQAVEAIPAELALPAAVSVRISLADAYLRGGYYGRAVEVGQEVHQLAPENPAALAVWGAGLFYGGQAEEGIEQLRAAVEMDHDYPWARRQLALIYNEQARYEEAAELLADSLASDPDDAWSQHQLALNLRAAGRVEEAIEELARACRATAYEDEQLLGTLVSTLQESGRVEQALETVVGALQHGPRSAHVRRMAVRLLADAEAWDTLPGHVGQLLADQPDDPEMRLYRGVLAARAGDAEAVEEHVAAALAQEPGDDDTLYRMTRLLVELRRWDEAVDVFERIASWDDPYVCFQGLRIYARHPRHAETCLELARAGNEAVGGEDYYYLTQTAHYAGMLGLREEAVEAVAQAIAIDPEEPSAYLLLAAAEYPGGRHDAALAAIDRAEALGHPTDHCDWCRIDVLVEAERWEALDAVAARLEASLAGAVADDPSEAGPGEEKDDDDELEPRDEDEERWLVRVHRAQAALRLAGPEAFAAVVDDGPPDGWPARLLARLAGIAYEAEAWGLAREYVERALAVDSGSEWALYHLGLLRERTGDAEGALGAYEELIDRHPERHIGHENWGRLASLLGRVEEAEEPVHRGVEIEPRCSAAWSALACWQIAAGSPAAALPALVRADQLQPGRPYAEIDRALRAALEGDTVRARQLLEAASRLVDRLGPLWTARIEQATPIVIPPETPSALTEEPAA